MKRFTFALLAVLGLARGAAAQENWIDVSNTSNAESSIVNSVAENPQCQGHCWADSDGNWFEMFRSDHEFDDFISPVTNPVWFEDPRSLTQVRGVFINQRFKNVPAVGTGDAQVYGLQAWLALNERFSIVAPKDGWVELQSNGILGNQHGWADIATGFKYVVVRDPCAQFLLSTGMIYEWSNGTSSVLQGNGDGVFNFFVSTAKGWGDTHFMGTAGWHLPSDGAAETESVFLSLHLDQKLTDKLYALVEMNAIQYVDDGKALPVNFEGGDLINLGATSVSGQSVITAAVGGAYKWSESVILSAAWEFPMTDREDLLDNRVTATLTWRY